MSDFRSDLPYIKWGLGALLIALGISGSAIFLSQSHLDQSQLNHDTAKHRLTAARKALTTATDDKQNMASYAQEYALLLKRHVIGKEQRLDWLDSLERLRNRHLVMGFDYSISPQKTYQLPLQVDTGNFDLMRSDMSLSLDLLHEGQLMAFLDALRTSSSGWFMLDGCSLTRIPGHSGDSTVAQLKAECKGGWVTLKNRNKPR